MEDEPTIFEDPIFAAEAEEVDLRSLGATGIILFARALETFGLYEPEATKVARNILQKKTNS